MDETKKKGRRERVREFAASTKERIQKLEAKQKLLALSEQNE